MSTSVTASVVLYGHRLDETRNLFERLSTDPAIARWAVIDNGGSAEALDHALSLGALCLRPGRNLGYGAAHNLALLNLADVGAEYHVILNPDIMLGNRSLTELAAVMNTRPDVGLLMPRVVYPDGSIQLLCKLLPAPFDLLLRRFAPAFVKKLARKRIATFNLQNFDYKTPVSVPFLSGCFMFARRSVLDAVNGFDERFFLYMEDVDLCRRMATRSGLVYWPQVTVTHEHKMESYKNYRVLLLHLRSAITYFNKWGWIFDSKRRDINRATIEDLRRLGYDM